MAASALNSLAAVQEQEDEELEDLPADEKTKDPYNKIRISRTIDGIAFQGVVEDIECGKITKERLYRVKYDDGDLEHFTDAQCEEFKVVAAQAVTAPRENAPKQKAKAKAKAAAVEVASPKRSAAPLIQKKPAAADEEAEADEEEEEEEEPEAEEPPTMKKPAVAKAAATKATAPASKAKDVPVQKDIAKAKGKAKAKAQVLKKPAGGR